MLIEEINDVEEIESPERLRTRVENACKRMPPLWPLKSFVAVNPFVGLSELKFSEACRLIKVVSHEEMTLPASAFAEAWKNGEIEPRDLIEAIAASGDCWTVEGLCAALGQPEGGQSLCQTVADLADRANGQNWSAFVVEEVSKWCASYYDDSQALWRMPWRELSLYEAWKRGAELDRTPEVSGLRGFRKAILSLPNDPWAAIEMILGALKVPDEDQETFLHRQLMTVRGWAGHVQYLARENSLRGKSDDSLVYLLAVRLAYDFALQKAFALKISRRKSDPKLTAPLAVWQDALEIAHRRSLYARLQSPGAEPDEQARAEFQAVFCIDVRSEVLRRALETVAPGGATIGFAGFFGFPIEVVSPGAGEGAPHCPVLLVPPYKVVKSACCEGTSFNHETKRAQTQRGTARLWKYFKSASVTCFPFVETLGLTYSAALVRDSFALSAKRSPSSKGFEYRIVSQESGASAHGIPLHDRVGMAEAALRNMGLTEGFARLVLLCGHGSQTANNPYGSALDCGACGGHSGEANARVAAWVLNEAAVRRALKDKGIDIPEDTVFVAGLHNTTTDVVEFLGEVDIPASHIADWKRLRDALAAAGEIARAERAGALGLSDLAFTALRKALEIRSRNWAEVQPEWALAGNHAFIAAPRYRTQTLDLKGRAFLHDYDHRKDHAGQTLEMILSAPMVVANWINMQYFASASNNRLFGSGNKVLHNVVGRIGVLEGNGGDLRTGLPWQSVRSGTKLAHTPVRLNVFIEAPRENIDKIISKHTNVRQLVDHQWLHLHAWENEGANLYHRKPGGGWCPVSGPFDANEIGSSPLL